MGLFVLGGIVVIIMVYQLSSGLISDAVRIAPDAVTMATKILETHAPEVLAEANVTSTNLVDSLINFKWFTVIDISGLQGVLQFVQSLLISG